MQSFTKHLDWIENEKEEMVKTLIEWSHINSGSYNLDGLAKMAAAIKSKFAKLDADIQEINLDSFTRIDQGGNPIEQELGKALLINKRPEAKFKIFLCGHMDTVFAADHHFQKCTELDPNTLNGPGVADLKGGLLVMLKALEAYEQAIKDNDSLEQIGWQVLINPDEEIGSPGSSKLFVDAAKNHKLGLIFEPSLPDGTLVSARKGVGNFTVVAKGISAHSGREFDKGRNAINALAQFICKANALNQSISDITLNIGTIKGGKAINVVPELAITELSIRTQKQENEKEVLAELEKIIKEINREDGIELKIHGSFNRKPKPVTKEIEKLFAFLQSCAQDIGIKLDWAATGGCCDGNNLAAAGLPNLDTLGVRGANIHTDQEYVLLDSLTERAKLSALLMMKLSSGELNW